MLKKHRSYCGVICWLFFIPALSPQTVDFTSSNLPIVVIDTKGWDIPNNSKITAEMGVIDNGEGNRNRVTDPFNAYSGKIGIEIRGSSSSGYRKKSYNVETRDSNGGNLNVPLLGCPSENDWILYGPYVDKSALRNALMYRLSNRIGRYAVRTKFCELVLNGEYNGLYVLMETIKQDKNRVKVSPLDPDDVQGDSLTGGYIIKLDRGDSYFISHYPPWPGATQQIRYQFHDPDGQALVDRQKRYIEEFVNAFEAVMSGPDVADPEKGYPKYIDEDSLVDHFLLNEICKNVDGYRLSAFLYKQRDSKGGKLHAGPIWDMDLAAGNANYYGAENPEGWELDSLTLNSKARRDGSPPPFWWEKLVRDHDFGRRIRTRWLELRTGTLATDNVKAYIEAMADTLAEAQARNFEIWSGPGEGGESWWPVPDIFYTFTTYRDEVDYLESWLEQRFEWMDAHIFELTGMRNPGRSAAQPDDFVLRQNYPNPFNAVTVIEYRLPKRSSVRLEIADPAGRTVRILFNGAESAGSKRLAWDGKDDSGRAVPSGIYICRLRAESENRIIKITVLK